MLSEPKARVVVETKLNRPPRGITASISADDINAVKELIHSFIIYLPIAGIQFEQRRQTPVARKTRTPMPTSLAMGIML